MKKPEIDAEIGELIASIMGRKSDGNDEEPCSIAFISDRHYASFTERPTDHGHSQKMAKQATATDGWKRYQDVLTSMNALYRRATGNPYAAELTKFVDSCCMTAYTEDEELSVMIQIGFYDPIYGGEATVESYLAANRLNFPGRSDEDLKSQLIFALMAGNTDLILADPQPTMGTPGWTAPLNETMEIVERASALYCKVMGCGASTDDLTIGNSKLASTVAELLSDYSDTLPQMLVWSLLGMQKALPLYTAVYNAMVNTLSEATHNYFPTNGQLKHAIQQAEALTGFIGQLQKELVVTNAYLAWKSLPTL